MKPSSQEQLSLIREIIEQDETPIVGASYYLVPYNWFSNWKKYVKYPDAKTGEYSSEPSILTTSELIENGKLKEGSIFLFCDRVDF
jgi:hypothetical protein